MLSLQTQRNLEDLLISQNILRQDQLDDFKLRSIQTNVPLMAIIQDADMIDGEQLTRLLAMASNIKYVNLQDVIVPPQILGKIQKELAGSYRAIAFGKTGGKLAVAMVDPTNIQAVDFLSRKIGEPISTFMASQGGIERVLMQYSAEIAGELKDAITEAEGQTVEKNKRLMKQNAAMQNMVQDAPITRALNTILEYAVNAKASDIHVEPRADDLRIRFRIDGVLQETMKLPKAVEPALVSRIKILANLKIDEHRIPQDGTFQVHAGGKDVDLRIAIAPITHGEQIVIRLLDKSNTLLTLENLGFKGRAFRVITEGIHKPHGMTLATGPTGSGKSTTLYAVIQAVKDVSINIVTLEDPVEYKMDGINQIQVNGDVGLTFASGLRSILRQDPNVIMVGEIRDHETAGLAVQSALTGHVVLSTIHTNSGAGVLPRLLDMGVEPFLVASTVNTIIGQRLVRRICEHCSVSFEANATQAESIRHTLKDVLPKDEPDLVRAKEDLGYDYIPLVENPKFTLYRGKGCDKCTDGYKGRIGIYEVFGLSETMERLLANRATTNEIQTQAQKDGMITMKQDGYFKALNGITTLEEVARVASDF